MECCGIVEEPQKISMGGMTVHEPFAAAAQTNNAPPLVRRKGESQAISTRSEPALWGIEVGQQIFSTFTNRSTRHWG